MNPFNTRHDFLIAFDSDGCVFDNMESKHRECFCPAAIKYFSCEPVAPAAAEVWDFVNLYGRTRGCNRFVAVRLFLDLLQSHPAVLKSGFEPPRLEELDEWLASGQALSRSALIERISSNGSSGLEALLAWSDEVNSRVASLAGKPVLFPGVTQVMETARDHADMIVVSQAAMETLRHEWTEAGLANAMSFIGGQEHGTKTKQLQQVAARSGYSLTHMLMVGDAPGDLDAARANEGLFFPIIPGREAESWDRLCDDGLRRFFDGSFAGRYQKEMIDMFEVALPETRSWMDS
jgi:phosphoglycolate phosphatase-like HAD superfamily hydrolase